MSGFIEKTFNFWKGNKIFFCFLILYTSVLVYLCNALNVWVDETYALNTTSRGLLDVVHQSYTFEAQLPLYFVLLSLWRHICSSIFFARLFSLVFIGLAAWAFSRVSELLSGKENTKWMVVVFLLNPFTVWAALEIRLYAFLIFLSILSFYFFLMFFLENRKKYLYFFLFTCLIGLYTQYFFAVLIGVLALALLVFKGWKAWYKFFLYLIPVGLLFLPNLMFISSQIKVTQSHTFTYTFTERITEIFLHSPKDLFLGFSGIFVFKIIKDIIIIVVFSVLLIAYYRWNKKSPPRKRIYFSRLNLLIFVVGFLILFISLTFAIWKIDFQIRYLAIVFPLLILLYSLFKIYSLAFQKGVFAFIALVFTTILVYKYRHPVKQYDYKSIEKYIVKIEKSDEPILFYHGTISLPFTYYYNGQNSIIPLPHRISFDSTFRENIQDTIELEQSIKNIQTKSKSYLFISDLAEPEYDENVNRMMVNDYISSHYYITFDTLFYGYSEKPLRIRRFQISDENK